MTWHLCAFQIQKLSEHKGANVHYVTFVQSLFAKSWTKLDMSPKCVCPFSTKTAENNWKFVCSGKAWLIIVTWCQKVQMTKNWTRHLCALNSRYSPAPDYLAVIRGGEGGKRKERVGNGRDGRKWVGSEEKKRERAEEEGGQGRGSGGLDLDICPGPPSF